MFASAIVKWCFKGGSDVGTGSESCLNAAGNVAMPGAEHRMNILESHGPEGCAGTTARLTASRLRVASAAQPRSITSADFFPHFEQRFV